MIEIELFTGDDGALKRIILIGIGSVSVGLGVLGILIPVLPTTPFLLLASVCYLRSSEKCYNWLLNNKLLGKHVRSYVEGKGVPVKTKIIAIIMIWTSILFCVNFVVTVFLFKIMILIIAICVTIYIIRIKPHSPQKATYV